MTPTKAPSSRQLAPFVSRALKTAGVVLILAALLDIIVLPLPFQPLERAWQLGFVTQVVDRGIVPLVGIALYMVGVWLDGGTGDRKTWQTGRFWVLLLASLLGLLYLLMFPLHLNNVRLNNTAALSQISQEATQAESQLDTRLNAEVQQQRAQIDQLINATDEQLTQAQQAGLINEEQANLIRQFKQEPDTLQPYLDTRVGELRTRLQTEIGVRREQAQRAARTESLKSGLRIGLGSLILAIGYILVGWTGLRAIGQLPSGRGS